MSEPRINGVPVVLIVEEDESVRMALVQLLEEAGYRATTVRDGEKALIRLRHGLRPCLILLDGPDRGFRIAQLNDPLLAAIPTVALADADAHVQLRGAVRALPSPFDPDELLELVDTHCSSAGAARLRREQEVGTETISPRRR